MRKEQPNHPRAAMESQDPTVRNSKIRRTMHIGDPGVVLGDMQDKHILWQVGQRQAIPTKRDNRIKRVAKQDPRQSVAS